VTLYSEPENIGHEHVWAERVAPQSDRIHVSQAGSLEIFLRDPFAVIVLENTARQVR
jgi:hypothetical protein